MTRTDWHGLTPITRGLDTQWSYKREDLFAPFGCGGINGSKLRQVYHLCECAVNRGYSGIVSGAVAASPQHPMVTRVAREHGLTSTVVTGASRIEAYPMLVMAGDYGAQFELSPVGYATTLNAIARKLAAGRRQYHLETNITLTGTAQEVYDFHLVGAAQVANVPPGIEAMLIPAGSCNSAVSVLVGIAESPVEELREVVLFGIGAQGSTDPGYIPNRLRQISEASGVDYADIYDIDIDRPVDVARKRTDGRIKVLRYDLNGSGYCKYADLMPGSRDGINFHPRYEGKIIRYVTDRGDEFRRYDNDRVCFWNVGTEPR